MNLAHFTHAHNQPRSAVAKTGEHSREPVTFSFGKERRGASKFSRFVQDQRKESVGEGRFERICKGTFYAV